MIGASGGTGLVFLVFRNTQPRSLPDFIIPVPVRTSAYQCVYHLTAGGCTITQAKKVPTHGRELILYYYSLLIPRSLVSLLASDSPRSSSSSSFASAILLSLSPLQRPLYIRSSCPSSIELPISHRASSSLIELHRTPLLCASHLLDSASTFLFSPLLCPQLRHSPIIYKHGKLRGCSFLLGLWARANGAAAAAWTIGVSCSLHTSLQHGECTFF